MFTNVVFRMLKILDLKDLHLFLEILLKFVP